MKISKDNLFAKEQKVLKQGEAFLKQDQLNKKALIENYTILLKSYKKLLRQTKTLTRVSDNQQLKLNRILDRMGKYLSYQLVKKITHEKEDVEIKTQRKKLTVFFSDLKDFSYISSHMEGEALSEFLNSYLELMTQIVIKWGGTLDKYIGDAVMVFFGDPEFTSDQDHALRCVSMAIEMRDKMKAMRKKWYNMGYQEPLHCRIGIATGYCTVGNFGSSERMHYTILGAPVNLASRLESAADIDEIFISHETWGYVKDDLNCDPPVSLNLKGFHHPILAHKVLSSKDKDSENLFFINDEIRGINIKLDFETASKDQLISIIKMQKQFCYSATHDSLTGLLNREAIVGRLNTEISRAQRENTPLSIGLLDIDDFHQINADYGRTTGDDILRKCVKRISLCLRNYDIVGRYSGDVFMLIIPGTNYIDAKNLFERIRKNIEHQEIESMNIKIFVTACMGCATFEGNISLDTLINVAQDALARAKAKGRNCVECFGFDD